MAQTSSFVVDGGYLQNRCRKGGVGVAVIRNLWSELRMAGQCSDLNNDKELSSGYYLCPAVLSNPEGDL